MNVLQITASARVKHSKSTACMPSAFDTHIVAGKVLLYYALLEINYRTQQKGYVQQTAYCRTAQCSGRSDNPKHISVSMDGRHNARGFKSSYKPGQSSSQAFTVAIEDVTKEKYIIEFAVENK